MALVTRASITMIFSWFEIKITLSIFSTYYFAEIPYTYIVSNDVYVSCCWINRYVYIVSLIFLHFLRSFYCVTNILCQCERKWKINRKRKLYHPIYFPRDIIIIIIKERVFALLFKSILLYEYVRVMENHNVICLNWIIFRIRFFVCSLSFFLLFILIQT